MQEIVINLHVHTPLSDGNAVYSDLAETAARVGLDGLIITDHNVLPSNLEGIYETSNGRVLLLTGEEIHDQSRDPQKNHLLVFNPKRDYSDLAQDPSILIDQVHKNGGLSFLAHPADPALPAFHEPDISWTSWDFPNLTGLELWNGFSELKQRGRSVLRILFFAFFPDWLPLGPHPEVLRKWDEQTAKNRRLVAIGGSDSHAIPYRIGPFTKTIFPYEYHFRAINTHLLLPSHTEDDFNLQKSAIFQAMRQGSGFVANDLLAWSKGFHFSAVGQHTCCVMGGSLKALPGVTFQIQLPNPAECLLIRNGVCVQRWNGQSSMTFITKKPGAYRIEAYRSMLGIRRGWIFSNPIYLEGE